MLTFRFRHSRSDDLPWLVELAKRGTFKAQALSPKLTVYETTFDLLDPIQLGHALSLATALIDQRKAEAFANGQSVRLVGVREVLHCYQQSLHVEDPKAYCRVVMRWRFDIPLSAYQPTPEEERQPFEFPCRKAVHLACGLSPEQSGTVIDKIQSVLLRAGTHWCPRLADRTTWQDSLVSLPTHR